MSLLKAAAALALVASLAGCAATVQHLETDISAVKAGVQTLADAQVPANIAIAGAYGFDTAEIAATDILIDCTPHTPPLSTQLPAALCGSQHANIATMAASIKAGRPIRNAIEPAAGQTLPVSQSAYSKLQSIISTLTAAVNAFNAAKAGN